MRTEPLTYNQFIKKYEFKQTAVLIAYELYLIIQYLKSLDEEDNDE